MTNLPGRAARAPRRRAAARARSSSSRWSSSADGTRKGVLRAARRRAHRGGADPRGASARRSASRRRSAARSPARSARPGALGFTRNLRRRRSSTRCAACARRSPPGGALTQRRLHGHGRAAPEPARRARGDPPARRPEGPSASRRGASPSRRRASCRRSPSCCARAPVNLAVSLHATTDAVRDELVPLNRRFPLRDAARRAARRCPSCRGAARSSSSTRCIEGVNDSPRTTPRGWCAARRDPREGEPDPDEPAPGRALPPAGARGGRPLPRRCSRARGSPRRCGARAAPTSTPPAASSRCAARSRRRGAPRASMLYAIGDIHGELELLDELLDAAAARARRPAGLPRRLRRPRPRLERRGRAPDRRSRERIDVHLPAREPRVDVPRLPRLGGRRLLRRRRVPRQRRRPHARELRLLRRAAPRRELRAAADAHRAFFAGCALWHQEGDYLFVHAGARPARCSGAATSTTRCAARGPRTCSGTARPATCRTTSASPIVYGHTPRHDFQVRWNVPFSIGIDTGAVYGGPLTAIRLPDETHHPEPAEAAALAGCVAHAGYGGPPAAPTAPSGASARGQAQALADRELVVVAQAVALARSSATRQRRGARRSSRACRPGARCSSGRRRGRRRGAAVRPGARARWPGRRRRGSRMPFAAARACGADARCAAIEPRVSPGATSPAPARRVAAPAPPAAADTVRARAGRGAGRGRAGGRARRLARDRERAGRGAGCRDVRMPFASASALGVDAVAPSRSCRACRPARSSAAAGWRSGSGAPRLGRRGSGAGSGRRCPARRARDLEHLAGAQAPRVVDAVRVGERPGVDARPRGDGPERVPGLERSARAPGATRPRRARGRRPATVRERHRSVGGRPRPRERPRAVSRARVEGGSAPRPERPLGGGEAPGPRAPRPPAPHRRRARRGPRVRRTPTVPLQEPSRARARGRRWGSGAAAGSGSACRRAARAPRAADAALAPGAAAGRGSRGRGGGRPRPPARAVLVGAAGATGSGPDRARPGRAPRRAARQLAGAVRRPGARRGSRAHPPGPARRARPRPSRRASPESRGAGPHGGRGVADVVSCGDLRHRHAVALRRSRAACRRGPRGGATAAVAAASRRRALRAAAAPPALAAGAGPARPGTSSSCPSRIAARRGSRSARRAPWGSSP